MVDGFGDGMNIVLILTDSRSYIVITRFQAFAFTCDLHRYAAAAAATAAGGIAQRWGADGGDRWAGYDRSRIAGTLENLNQPSFFDKVPGEQGYVPWVKTVEEVERLLVDKVMSHGSNRRGPRDVWKYFDRDGSGSVDREEFETALSHFNISAGPDVIDAFMKKYDTDGDGEMDYIELLKCLLPETAGGAAGKPNESLDTVSYIKRLDVNDKWGPNSREVRPGRGRPDLAMELSEPSLTTAGLCQLNPELDP
jgi:hypothetical protein